MPSYVLRVDGPSTSDVSDTDVGAFYDAESVDKDNSAIQDGGVFDDAGETVEWVLDERLTHGGYIGANPYSYPTTEISIGPWRQGGQDRALRGLTARSLTVNLLDPSVMSLSIPGLKEDSKYLVEGEMDVCWRRDDDILSRQRLAQVVHDLQETTYTISCQAFDYRKILDERILEIPGDSSIGFEYTNKAPEDMVWDVVSKIQAQPGGNYGIEKGVWAPSNVLVPSQKYSDGDSAWKVIKQLMAADPYGFDFDIDEDLKANFYYPMRSGRDTGAVLDYGGMATKMQITKDMASFANAIRQSGVEGSAPYHLVDPQIAQAAVGRWDKVFADQSLLNVSMIQQAAGYNYKNASRLVPTFDITLAPGRWGGREDFWVGDVVTVVAKLGSLNINSPFRVYSMKLSLSQESQETVVATVGRPKLFRIRHVVNSLKILNKK